MYEHELTTSTSTYYTTHTARTIDEQYKKDNKTMIKNR